MLHSVRALESPNGDQIRCSPVLVGPHAVVRADHACRARPDPRSCGARVASTLVSIPRPLALPTAMCVKSYGKPLSNSELVSFIRDGFLVLQPSVHGGESLHSAIYEKASQLPARGLCGNNFMRHVPEVSAILDAPEVVGALTSLLGEDYVLGASRHCHITKDGSAAQTLHQDDFFGFNNYRHAAPTELMLFYYPQVVTPLMGPTAVIPRSHYSKPSTQEGPWGPETPHEEQAPLTLPRPGSCLLMHWHLWHRATEQLGGAAAPVRYAFKMQFRRIRPFAPAPQVLLASCGDAQRNPFYAHGTADIENDGLRNGGGPTKTSHDLRCAAVWATLCNRPLPQEFLKSMREVGLNDEALAVACGAWPVDDAVPALLDVATGRAPGRCGQQSRESQEFAASLHPRLAEQLRTDPRCSAAAALQLCGLQKTGGDVARSLMMAIDREIGTEVHPWAMDLRLECLAAVAELAPPADALPILSAELSTGRPPRAQFQACIGIHKSAVRFGAPDAPDWQRAAQAAHLESRLLACVGNLCSWGRQAGLFGNMSPKRFPADDGCLRYALVESLRCVGRCCSERGAREALSLAGENPQTAGIVGAPGWREEFARFVERGRHCPVTSAASSF
mmetsp:Transcript_126667/g.366636  ORF Transcript_126667/g.366636 Transcript_126667/m.366636 type:complete len:619 (-) Transcript_126667:119-1975(-)